MDLTQLAGSQMPNGIAVASGIVLFTIAAIAYRSRPGMRAILAGFGMLAGSVVLAKNLMYTFLVTDAKGEQLGEAWRGYADVLQYVATAQIVIATCLTVISMMAGRSAWLIVFAALAHAWAGLCMLSWRSGYLALDPTKPVRFEPLAPVLHWALLGLMAVALVLALITLMRRPKKQ